MKIALLLLAPYAAAATVNLMPMPATVIGGNGSLTVTGALRVTFAGYSDARLKAAAERLTARIARQTGIPAVHSASDPMLIVSVAMASPDWPKLGEDESYELTTGVASVTLKAATSTGALRGMETFAQLVGLNGKVDGVTVSDKPRYPWRGLMLDVSRHWMPVDVVLRNLDAMAAVKLNVFHWHLADDQGFRVESKRFPLLQEKGSDGFFYTQDEIRRVVDYARDRSIRVIPEFDIPAHTTAWFAGYPELASGPGPYEIERRWGVFKPTMDPSKEEVYTFLDSFLEEMTSLFPDAYFHIGGDEVEGSQWKNSAAIQKFATDHGLKDQAAIHGYFNRRVQAILKKHGKIMIGWDEVLQPGLAADTIIQSWRGPTGLAAAAKLDYRGLLSYGYYLDHLRPTSYHYGIDPGDDPHVLGGEACMWNEYVSSENIDSRIWPRMIAIAERFWSPRSATGVESMYERMEAVSRQLDFVGLRHHSYQGSMLARIAGAAPIEPYQVLADAVETARVETRRRAQKYTSLIPLNRMVDAAHPESEAMRLIELAVTRRDFVTVRAAFNAWAANDARMGPLVKDPVAELTTLSMGLSAAGRIGLHALDYLEKHEQPTAEWIKQQNEALDGMAKPSAELLLAAVRPVRALVEATRKP